MVIGETKNWIVEQGSSGNELMIFKGSSELYTISYFAFDRTIGTLDKLPKFPKKIAAVINKWIEKKAHELLAEVKVIIEGDAA